MDPNQVKDVEAAIDRVTKAIEKAKSAASELADDFRTTTETLNAAYNSLNGVDKLIKQSLNSEFKKLDTTVKNIRNTHQSLLSGYFDEKKDIK
jgi:ABC-type transporter Mla subunit MlaD